MSLARLRLVVRTYSPAQTWNWIGLAVDSVNNYIYISGNNAASASQVYAKGCTYNSSTNVLTLSSQVIVQNGSLTWGGTGGISANYRGLMVSLIQDGGYNFKVYTFNGSSLTYKAGSAYLNRSPAMCMDVSFRVGINSDDIVIAQNSKDWLTRIVTATWDGSSTIVDGVLGSSFGNYARRIHANANFYVSSGYQTAPTFGTFSISSVARIASFGDQDAEPYVSPYINRVYTMQISNYVKVYDLTTSATLVATLYPNIGTIINAFEDSNNVVYFCGQNGIAAYTYSAGTYTLRSVLPAPNNVTLSFMEGDSAGNLFVIGSDKRIYVIKAQWYQTNPMILGQHI